MGISTTTQEAEMGLVRGSHRERFSKKRLVNELHGKTYSVIRFKDGRRVSSYGGLTANEALSEAQEATERGLLCLVFTTEKEPKTSSWLLADYIKQ